MAKQYIIQGFYPDNVEYRTEVVSNSLNDAMNLAQGLLKLTTLESTYLIDASIGRLLAKFGDHLTR